MNEYKKEYKFIDITENPPSKSALQKIIAQSGESVKKFFNTSGGEYKKLNLKDKINLLKDSELIELLANNGMLVKRPIVTDNEKTTVGFNEDIFKKTWKK